MATKIQNKKSKTALPIDDTIAHRADSKVRDEEFAPDIESERTDYSYLTARVQPTTPLRLAIAATIAFPDGSMTASGLRRECERGRLVVEMIAGKTYTTLEAIDRMRTLCRVEKKGLGSGSENRGTTEVLNAMPLGSFSTAHAISPQDALRAKLNGPNKSSPNISQTNTSQRGKRKISKTS